MIDSYCFVVVDVVDEFVVPAAPPAVEEEPVLAPGADCVVEFVRVVDVAFHGCHMKSAISAAMTTTAMMPNVAAELPPSLTMMLRSAMVPSEARVER
jgi:hypothetical protein